MLTGIQLGCKRFDWMVQRQWALLEVLGFRYTGIDAAAMSELAHAHMNDIVSLDVAGNALGPAAIAALVTASLPGLLDLYLNENRLDTAAAQRLLRGNWPKLTCLALDDNLLDNVAMRFLAHI